MCVVPIVFALFVGLRLVNAQIAPSCQPGFEWLYNSKNQGPCEIASILCATCNDTKTFDLQPLEAADEYYTDPDPNECQCNTVTYSLVGACGLCQGGLVDTWSDYQIPCPTVFIEQYVKTIPDNTSIPAWAYLDVVTSNTFNLTIAHAFWQSGDHADSSALSPTPTSTSLSPSTSASNSSTSSASSASSTSVPSTPSASAPSSKDDVAPIVGGIIGGIAGIAVIVGAVAFYLLKRRSTLAEHAQPTASYTPAGPVSPFPLPEKRLYDPSDPSTYPSHTDLVSYPSPSLQLQSSPPPSVHRYPINYGGSAEI